MTNKNKNKNISSHINVIKKKMADAIGSRIAGPYQLHKNLKTDALRW
jgi:hypothetical protein